MKPEEQKTKLNVDAEEDTNKTLNSDKPESPSLSPFFWLREEEEEGATAGSLSEPPSLDTPMCHNAPTFSDIMDSDDELPNNMTPNVSSCEHFFCFFLVFWLNFVHTIWLNVLQSKTEVSEIFDSEIFEWSQRPCSPELRSTPVKKQVFWLTEAVALYFPVLRPLLHSDYLCTFFILCVFNLAVLSLQGKSKKILDQITETDDEEDMSLGGSFDKLDHESNAAQLVNGEEVKKRKSARARTKKNSKLPVCGKLCIKGCDADHQVADIPVSVTAKPGQKNSGKKESNTLSGRNKISCKSSRFLCSSDKSRETFPPQEDSLEVEAPENQLPERSHKNDKDSQRKLERTGNSASKTAENKCEQRSKRIRRISDGAVADKIRVISATQNKTESPQHHTLIKGCTQHEHLDGKSKQSMESNIGPNTPSPLLGRWQFNEARQTVPSVKNVLAMNGSVKAIEQSAETIRSCTARNAVLQKCEDKCSKKKCEDKAPKVSCAFCQSDDITEVYADKWFAKSFS
jgi:BRCA1-associated RING domain protein 1